MCFVIMELFTNLSPNGTTEHFPISRESKNNTYVVYYIKRGGDIFGRRGAGNSFTMSHTTTRGSSRPYMDLNFFCDLGSGVGLCPYMRNGCDYGLIWKRLSALGFWGDLKTTLPTTAFLNITNLEGGGPCTISF